uniref:Uncharacterized protein n=1 Tax=Arundo donax TaxID=35708 RepID=A0A0A9GEG7_ARUDO
MLSPLDTILERGNWLAKMVDKVRLPWKLSMNNHIHCKVVLLRCHCYMVVHLFSGLTQKVHWFLLGGLLRRVNHQIHSQWLKIQIFLKD